MVLQQPRPSQLSDPAHLHQNANGADHVTACLRVLTVPGEAQLRKHLDRKTPSGRFSFLHPCEVLRRGSWPIKGSHDGLCLKIADQYDKLDVIREIVSTEGPTGACMLASL
ncbi:hypothetical protein PGIGA_G00038850 [Pangasianodon gigas]|uniref:Uncharacterized protein n=1 Tax=Pangasianodon gigas TaxID=30993 RepID=A0ACC5X0S8_PANGG|nr:hypothetical protein [Pangasianodon gigas]